MMLPYTDFFKYLGMVCDKQINLNTAADATLCPFPGRHVQSQRVCPESKTLFRNITSLTGYTRTYGFSHDICTRYSGCYVYESDLGHSLFTTRQRGGQSPSEMAVGSVEKDVGSQTHHAFMVCHMYVWIGTPTVQLISRGNVAVQFLTKSNSYTMKKVFHADMQLSTRSK
jgi:hypothetical protein